MSLLLVEDDRGDAAVLVEELISEAVADIDVVWAQSMAHAERVLVSARPDCVLLDLNLPDASGIDALDRIAKHDATVPIVVLTGLNDEYFGASAVAAGAQDYLVKGRVEPEMLRRALLYGPRPIHQRGPPDRRVLFAGGPSPARLTFYSAPAGSVGHTMPCWFTS